MDPLKNWGYYMHAQTACTRPLLGGEGPGDEASMPYFFKAPNLPTLLLWD